MDLTSVEMFIGDGRVVHSHRVFPLTVTTEFAFTPMREPPLSGT
ncbi:GH32 C-terminal domain-containing protein [Pseudarthrobacter sp. NPDC092419]